MTEQRGSDAWASGPFSLPARSGPWGRGRARLAPLVTAALLLGLAACASPRESPEGPAEPPGPEPERIPESAEERAGTAALLDRLGSLRSTDPARAAAVADSAYFRWRGEVGLGNAALRALHAGAIALEAAGDPVEAESRLEELLSADPPEALAGEAARRLASLRIRLGLHPGAVQALDARWDHVAGAEGLELLRRAAAGLSVSELETALRGASGLGPDGRPVLQEELDGLRQRLSGRERPVPRVEVVLPLSGSLEPVGQSLRQGMEVALEAHRASGADSVAVVFQDDGSSEERARELVARAGRSDAVAVVGPARSGAFAAAMDEREDPSLLLLSPTATRAPGEGWNAFTLWELEHRERALAGELAGWMSSAAEIRKLAVLRPRGPAGAASEQAFRAGAGRAGGGVVAAAAYVADSTTFESEIGLLAGHDLTGIYVASRDPRTALQIAPQLSYYGLPEAAVAGGGGWSEPAVVRRLRGGSPSLYATAVFTDREDDTGWADFKAIYEKKYDRPLSANVLPALGYDAMKAVLAAASSVGLPRRGAVARAITEGAVEGATGRFRLERGVPAARRAAAVRLATDGGLVEADPGRLRAWIREARDRVRVQERRRRENAAARVRRWSGESDREGESGGGP